MLIKIDKDLHLYLESYVQCAIEYGTVGGNDIDLLCIVPPNDHLDSTLTDTGHRLHYKCGETNTDYTYCTPYQFLSGLINAHDPIYMEILQEGLLYDTPLYCLEDFKDQFITYKTVKAFIGVASRDLKQITDKNRTKKESFVEIYCNYISEWLEYTSTSETLTQQVADYKDRLLKTHNLQKVVDANTVLTCKASIDQIHWKTFERCELYDKLLQVFIERP